MSDRNSFFSHLIETGEFRISEDGRATLFGDYMFLMPPRVLLHLQQRLKGELGEEDAETFIQDLGKYQVRSALERYQERLNMGEISRSEVIDFAKKLMSILGIGNPKINTIKENRVVLTIKNPTFATEYKHIYGEAEGPIDYYLCGIMQEFFEDIILQESCTVIEKKCAATADNEKCVFVGELKD